LRAPGTEEDLRHLGKEVLCYTGIYRLEEKDSLEGIWDITTRKKKGIRSARGKEVSGTERA